MSFVFQHSRPQVPSHCASARCRTRLRQSLHYVFTPRFSLAPPHPATLMKPTSVPVVMVHPALPAVPDGNQPAAASLTVPLRNNAPAPFVSRAVRRTFGRCSREDGHIARHTPAVRLDKLPPSAVVASTATYPRRCRRGRAFSGVCTNFRHGRLVMTTELCSHLQRVLLTCQPLDRA